MIIRLIVGLGNPGEALALTRHNAGAWFVEAACARYNIKMQPQGALAIVAGKGEIDGKVFHCAVTTSPINNCGAALSALCNKHCIPPENILVAHDDLTLLPGIVRFRFNNKGSNCLHNGVKDVAAHLGSATFNRLRIGIGHPGIKAQVPKYVMGNVSWDQKEKIDAILQSCVDWMPHILDGKDNGWNLVMNNLHAAKPKFAPISFVNLIHDDLRDDPIPPIKNTPLPKFKP